MATDTNFEEMPIWKQARELYKEVVLITKRVAVCCEFRFVRQIKAAAGWVIENSAEGFERDSNLEFINHLRYAKGSVGEVRSQLYRGLDESFITIEEQKDSNTSFLTLAAGIANLIRYWNHCELKDLKFAGRNQKPSSQLSSPQNKSSIE